MVTKESLAELRQQIEQKYREALQALNVVSAYISNPEAASGIAAAPVNVGVRVLPPEPSRGELSRVDRVLGAISSRQFKTADQIATELGETPSDVRAVLYATAVKSKVQKKKEKGQPIAFRLRLAASKARSSADGNSPGAAALVRQVLGASPAGLTAREITAKIGAQVEAKLCSQAPIGSALFNMKKRGKITRDEETGLYRLGAIRPASKEGG
jgi:hypothetical protein